MGISHFRVRWDRGFPPTIPLRLHVMNLPNPRHPALIPQQRTRHYIGNPRLPTENTKSTPYIYIYICISIKPVLGGNEFQ